MKIFSLQFELQRRKNSPKNSKNFERDSFNQEKAIEQEIIYIYIYKPVFYSIFKISTEIDLLFIQNNDSLCLFSQQYFFSLFFFSLYRSLLAKVLFSSIFDFFYFHFRQFASSSSSSSFCISVQVFSFWTNWSCTVCSRCCFSYVICI